MPTPSENLFHCIFLLPSFCRTNPGQGWRSTNSEASWGEPLMGFTRSYQVPKKTLLESCTMLQQMPFIQIATTLRISHFISKTIIIPNPVTHCGQLIKEEFGLHINQPKLSSLVPNDTVNKWPACKNPGRSCKNMSQQRQTNRGFSRLLLHQESYYECNSPACWAHLQIKMTQTFSKKNLPIVTGLLSPILWNNLGR